MRLLRHGENRRGQLNTRTNTRTEREKTSANSNNQPQKIALSCWAIFTEVSQIQADYSLISLFKAIGYSMSTVRKVVHTISSKIIHSAVSLIRDG